MLIVWLMTANLNKGGLSFQWNTQVPQLGNLLPTPLRGGTLPGVLYTKRSRMKLFKFIDGNRESFLHRYVHSLLTLAQIVYLSTFLINPQKAETERMITVIQTRKIYSTFFAASKKMLLKQKGSMVLHFMLYYHFIIRLIVQNRQNYVSTCIKVIQLGLTFSRIISSLNPKSLS